jgi:hypothetical protein
MHRYLCRSQDGSRIYIKLSLLKDNSVGEKDEILFFLNNTKFIAGLLFSMLITKVLNAVNTLIFNFFKNKNT